MEEAVASVQHVTPIIENISSAARAESDAISGLNNGVSQLDGSTRRTSGLVEQFARAVQTVSEQVNGLASSLSREVAPAARPQSSIELPTIVPIRILTAPV
jgi:methyl-accepting chemotaxis protein